SHYLNISYGKPSLQETLLDIELFGSALASAFGGLFQDSTASVSTPQGSTGTIVVSSTISIDKKTELGLGFAYQGNPADFIATVRSNGTRRSTKIGSYKYNHYTFFLEFTTVYGPRKSLSSKSYFYGGLGLGYTIRKEKRAGEAVPTIKVLKSRLWLPQLTPIGFAVHSKRMRFKVDVGFGYRPFITGSVGFRINK
ncbi:MAG: hypothetical protein AAF391_11065, partial [Bacteroidota bacterium]